MPRAKSTTPKEKSPTPKEKPLGEYERKRHFEKTPEPPPQVAAPASKLRFCVQRHDATRLHYDFRLEVDGVLKSWAVPKGPSLDPAKRNLAMHVEDHPIDYGGFEGNIPKGEYGGGSVMLWDSGTYDVLGDLPARDQLVRGDFKIRLHGEKLNGDFAIVLMKGRGKGNEWLLIKKKDEFAQPGWDVEEHARSVLTGRTQEEIAANLPAHGAKRVKKKKEPKLKPAELAGAVERPMPATITPMAAYLADHIPSGDEWLFEVKWDGVRALCFIEGGEVTIFSRTGNRCDRQYPELLTLPHHVHADRAIIDAEIAVLDDKGRSSFSLIQPRIAQSDPNSISHLAHKTPATLFAFDLLYWDGFDLRNAVLAERKRALEAILDPDERIRFSQHFAANGEAMLEAARQAGLEGIIAKRADSKYEQRRSRCWLKIKIHNEQEFIICGFTHGERDYFSSLVLGVYEGDHLVHTGQVGTGFNEKSIRELHAKMEPLITTKPPFKGRPKIPRGVTWVKPELVCEVRFSEWTPDHQLRAPSFQGLRYDVDPRSVRRESAVAVADDETPATGSEGQLLSPEQKEAVVKVGAQTLKFTNLNKVFYPADGYTKRDVINYYNAVSDLIVPHLRDRPLSLKRYPNGIDSEFFFQKNAEDFADWVRVEPIASEERVINYVIANDRETLLYLANLGCIDQNPWMSRVGSLDKPDFMLIDLDPLECPYDMIIEAALLTRDVLDRLGLNGYPKTTGGDGMHIYVPLEARYTYDQVRSFCEIVSHLVVGEKPDLFTTPRAVSKRKKGRVYFDYLQIAESKTISAPYVLRAYPGAPVSTPLDWKEVKPGLSPSQFTIENAPERFESVGDLFRPVLDKLQRLEPAIERLHAMM